MQPESRNTLTFISVVGTKFFIRPCFLNHWTLEKICLFFLGTLFISFLVFHVTYEVWGLYTWEEAINYISLWIKTNKSNKRYPVFGKQHLPCIYENLHAQKRLPWYLVDPQPGSVAPLLFVIASLPSNEKSCVSSIALPAGLSGETNGSTLESPALFEVFCSYNLDLVTFLGNIWWQNLLNYTSTIMYNFQNSFFFDSWH